MCVSMIIEKEATDTAYLLIKKEKSSALKENIK